MHRNEAGFVEVDGEAGCRSKIIEDLLEVGNRNVVHPTENKGIVSVLEHRAWKIWGERVTHFAISPSFTDEALENVSDDDEKVWGEGVSAMNPVSRDTIKKDGGVAGGENLGHPVTPPCVEPPSFKDEE
jgi:hypothetical protein